MRLNKLAALLVISACVVTPGLARKRAPLTISAEECRKHHLPALNLMMPWNTGVANLRKLPEAGMYVKNEPTPPGGPYTFSISAYEHQPAGQTGLQNALKKQFPGATFEAAPDWQGHPACTFATGGGHAHTAYAAVQISAGSDSGALMLHGFGPYPDRPVDFAELSKPFAKVQITP